MGQEQIAGQTSIGVKPGDNPAPVQAPPVPQAAPMPAPQSATPAMAAPMMAQPESAPPPAPVAVPDVSPSAQDFIKQMESDGGEGEAPAQPGHPLLNQVKDILSNDLQSIRAKFKMGLARNAQEEETVLEQVYGKGNIKPGPDGSLMVRPEGAKAFKKFKNDQDFMDFANPMASLLLKQIQNAPETLAQLPGMAAQLGGTAAGTVAGFLSPVPGGAVVGGFAGGVLGSKAQKYVNQKIAESLGQNDPAYQYENKISSLADVMQNDYVQGAIGAVGGAFYKHGAMKAAENTALLAKGLTQEEATVLQGASKNEKSFANFVSSLRSYRDHFFPSEPSEESAGRQVMGASKKAMDDLGERIGAMKSDIGSEQLRQNRYLSPDDFLDAIKKDLTPHGITFDEVTGKASSSAARATLPSNVNPLLGLYDEALSSKYSKEGGMTIEETERHLEALKKYADYEAANLSPNSPAKLYRNAGSALRSDRAAHVAELYGGKDTPDAEFFKQSMSEFSQKIDSYNTLQGAFMDPVTQDAMAKKLSSSPSDLGVDAINSMEQILGADHPAIKNVKSSVVNRLIGKFSSGGSINADGFSKYLENPDNANFVGKLFEKPQDATVLKILLGQAKELQGATTATGKVMALVDRASDLMVRNTPGGKEAMGIMSDLTGNNKASIDYLKRVTLNRLFETAYGEERRKALLDTLGSIDKLTSTSKIVEVPLKLGSKMEMVKKYVPLVTQ